MIEIMRASAGSGKTYNLAEKYIRILLESDDPSAYRHILAVTFTNKATDEMKSRIIKELYVLASDPGKSDYREIFADMSLSEKSGISKKCKIILCNILHDYGSFSVSTIDKFFQRTLKSFSREVGQFASYQVELDKNSLAVESVDRILDSLTETNSEMLDWLTNSVEEQLENEGKFSLDRKLYEMAVDLKNDEHVEMSESLGIDVRKSYSIETLRNLHSKCEAYIKDYKSKVSVAASAVVDVMASAGVNPADSNRKFLCKVEGYVGLAPGSTVETPGVSFLDKAGDEMQWFSKAKAPGLLPKVAGTLDGPLSGFADLFGSPYKIYRTAILLRNQIYDLGIAGDLYREFDNLMKEKNVLSIDDSNHILKDIIDGTDAPFIYEKLGVRFENFLLDEFQDTSNIQWDNFRPLLKESDSNNHYNLIVGDVKQSIYRWRGSDWNLLDSKLKKQFPEAKESCLDSNFRSLENIVEFNNGFFKFAADCLDSLDNAAGTGKSISGIYKDVEQKVAVHESSEGSVALTFCSSESQKSEILESIRSVINSGGRYGDIAVLVRTNKIGSDIAEFLLAEKIPVISDDSLKVKSSITVRRLVALLAYFNDKNDSINAYLAESLGISKPESCHSLIDLCEILLRDLAKDDENLFSGEIPYIQAFMDDLLAWTSINGNSSGDFLKYWETADPKLGSPQGVDAVRIMTIHKSKGLSFPYVIFPYAEKVKLFTPESRWCHPDVSGTSLQGAAEGLYLVKLSSDKLQTVFADDYLDDRRKQLIDNLNTFYVASTRAAKGMHIIASAPSAKCLDVCRKSSSETYPFTDMSQILYWYAEKAGMNDGFVKEKEEAGTDESESRLNYKKGAIYDFSSLHGSEHSLSDIDTVKSEYPSYPINPEYLDEKSGQMKKKVRLDFSSDSYDFFSDDGKTGIEASVRLRGIVMHNILSKVKYPSDLEKAVDEVFESGDINENERKETVSFLRGRIQSVAGYGWFPETSAEVANEISLIDTDGRIYRPDRVIMNSDGRITVVDYKFGAQNEKYLFQVGKYAEIYKRMGYANVKAYLWYVPAGEIINASDLF